MGETRTDCCNQYTYEFSTAPIDAFIERKRASGVDFNYRDIVIATLVRVFYLRPRFNRFVVKGTFYQRNFIDVAMVMHKSLRTGEQETVIKCRFRGDETINEIKEKIDAEIAKALAGKNDTDNFSGGAMAHMPTWLLRIAARLFKFLDRWGMFSDKFLFTTSPFHTSIFLADLKSIHLDTTWHHLYNFGNCGFFCTLAKSKLKPVVDPKTGLIKTDTTVELGISQDERFTDGLLFSHMIKTAGRIMENLEVMERPATPDEIKHAHTPAEKKQLAKRAARAQKRAVRSAK